MHFLQAILKAVKKEEESHTMTEQHAAMHVILENKQPPPVTVQTERKRWWSPHDQ